MLDAGRATTSTTFGIRRRSHRGPSRGAVGQYDILLTDLACRARAASTCCTRSASADDSIVKIVMTGYATVDNAVNCLREGAYDFIQKPIRQGQLSALVTRARSSTAT